MYLVAAVDDFTFVGYAYDLAFIRVGSFASLVLTVAVNQGPLIVLWRLLLSL